MQKRFSEAQEREIKRAHDDNARYERMKEERRKEQERKEADKKIIEECQLSQQRSVNR